MLKSIDIDIMLICICSGNNWVIGLFQDMKVKNRFLAKIGCKTNQTTYF